MSDIHIHIHIDGTERIEDDLVIDHQHIADVPAATVVGTKTDPVFYDQGKWTPPRDRVKKQPKEEQPYD